MEKAFVQVLQFFKKCDEDLVPDEINALLGRFHDNYTISAIYDHSETSNKYMLCNYLPKGLSVPTKYTVLNVPATTWAVFDVPDCDMQPMWKRIWTASGFLLLLMSRLKVCHLRCITDWLVTKTDLVKFGFQ